MQLHQVETRIAVVGRLRILASDRGIAAIAFADWNDEVLVQDWLEAGWSIIRAASPISERFVAEIHSYGQGTLRRFTSVPDHRFLPPFLGAVLRECGTVPFGRTATYVELAQKAGNSRAARAAGCAMRRNPTPLLVPCHRVLGSNGLGGYTPGLELKSVLLAHEGVKIRRLLSRSG